MHLVLKNDVSELTRLIACLDGFCTAEALPESMGLPLHLIAEEVFVNCVRHGLSATSEHRIDILAERHSDAVWLEFRDRGVQFDPLKKARPDTAAEAPHRPIGGLGVEFARQLSAGHLEYQRVDGENRLRIRLPLPT